MKPRSAGRRRAGSFRAALRWRWRRQAATAAHAVAAAANGAAMPRPPRPSASCFTRMPCWWRCREENRRLATFAATACFHGVCGDGPVPEIARPAPLVIMHEAGRPATGFQGESRSRCHYGCRLFQSQRAGGRNVKPAKLPSWPLGRNRGSTISRADRVARRDRR